MSVSSSIFLRRKEQLTKKFNLVFNILCQVSYELFAMLLPLFTAPFISRVLGADALGIYSYSSTMATYFGLCGMLGVKNYGNREISIHHDASDRNAWFWSIYAVQLIASILMLLLYGIYVVSFVQENRLIAAVQAILIVVNMIDISWFFFGMEQFKVTTACSMLVKVLTTVSVFLLIRAPQDLLEYSLILGGGNLINQILLWILARKMVGRPVFDGRRILSHVKPMLLFFIPVVAVSLYTMMDKLMLGSISTKSQLGFYEACGRIISCASSVICAFGTVMMPRMTKLFANGELEKGQRYMKLSIQTVMAVAFAVSLGIVSVARIFAPVFWGEDFAPCASILSILALSVPFSGFANVLRMQYLIPNGMNRAYIISVVLGAVSNLIANSLLIPVCGAAGASIGTVIAEGLVCVVQCFFARKQVSIRDYLRCTIPFGAAGLVMYLVVHTIDQFASISISWLLVEILAGGSVYCILVAVYLYHRFRNQLHWHRGK